DRLHARVNVDGSETRTFAIGETVNANLAETLALVAEVLREPSFPAAEFETLKREELASLESERQSPESLTARALARYRNPYPFVDKPATSIEIETPDKANATMIARFGIPVSDTSPDFPALVVANQALGASGASRLWARVREKEGLSYGIRSSFEASSFEPNATIGMSAIFAPQNLGKLRSALSDELARAVRDGFTDAEVEQAKQSVLKQRQLARAQDAGVAAALMQQLYLDRRFEFSAKIDR